MDASTLHNSIVPGILRSIVKPVIDAGGTPQDVMVVLESVAAGVVTLVASQTTGEVTDIALVDKLADGIKARLPDLRFAGMNPKGNA